MNFRPTRVGKLFREELSAILERDLEFGGALVTITEVSVGKKLETAHVRVSVWPSEEGARVLAELREHRGKLQWALTKKIHIKPMPEIDFVLDSGPEHAAKIEKILLEEDPKTRE